MSSLQRASHHEAGHVVYQWQGGGEVEWTAVGKQDGEWQGATHAPPIESAMSEAIKLLLGGLCEALFVARDGSEVHWQLSLDGTLPSLLAACQPPFGFKQVAIHFHSQIGEQREPLIEMVDDLFSDDTTRVNSLRAQTGVDVSEAITQAIQVANSDSFWQKVEYVANQLIEIQQIEGESLAVLRQEITAIGNDGIAPDAGEEEAS